MFLVDSNIFLEFLLEQQNSDESKAFLKTALEKNVPLVCSLFSIHGIEAILAAKQKLEPLKFFLEDLERSKNILVYSTTIEEEKEIVSISQEIRLDFDDALQYFVAKQMRCQAIVSFDAHFDKTDLKRKTPSEIVQELQKQK